MTYRAAIIGCGRPVARTNENLEGFSIGYAHGKAYEVHPDIEIVAAADISAENAAAFAHRFGVASTYNDYRSMLDNERPDLVSVCTWPPLHKEMTVAAAQMGARMVLCEKPMACGLQEIDEMVDVCDNAETRLYINHQRRYAQPFSGIRRMISDGVLGQLVRLEGWVGDGWDLMSWGSHWVDMHRYFAGDVQVSQVLAQAPSSGRSRYGHPIEDQIIVQSQFENGVISHLHFGNHIRGSGLIVTGSDGTVLLTGSKPSIHTNGMRDPGELLQDYLATEASGTDAFSLAVRDIVSSYENGTESLIDSGSAQLTTEMMMAAYISAEESQVVNLPIDDRNFDLRAAQGNA